MTELRKEEERIVQFIRDYIKENKYAPSVREIAAAAELSSGSVINNRMHSVREKGYIGFVDRIPRALWVTDKGEAL